MKACAARPAAMKGPATDDDTTDYLHCLPYCPGTPSSPPSSYQKSYKLFGRDIGSCSVRAAVGAGSGFDVNGHSPNADSSASCW